MTDFDRLIDSHLRREAEPKKEGQYYPSEIGNCMRKTWYTYKQPKEMESELIRVFHVGDMIHDFMVDVLKGGKPLGIELIKPEVSLKIPVDDFVISGRADDAMLIRENGKNILVEVKSTKMVSMAHSPNSSHLMQLQVYLHYLRLQHGIIVYVDKNTLETKSFPVGYSPVLAEKAIQRFRQLHQALARDKIPGPEARLTPGRKWECGYCGWKEECWSVENEKPKA